MSKDGNLKWALLPFVIAVAEEFQIANQACK